MQLPVMPPVRPMLAKARATVPDQEGDADSPAWLYEPKWDGFRCIVFRDGDEVELGSRNEKPLTRYFPEVVEAVKAELPDRCVLDGELVVPREVDGRTRLDWESLSQRIHPAVSRITLLSQTSPAHLIAFDALAIGDDDLLGTPLRQRRARLEEALAGAGNRVHLTRTSTDADTARDWFQTFEGAGLDGVIAKRLDGVYRPDQRDMVKVKHHRTADCVVVGYRKHKSIDGIGSLLLGLYAKDSGSGDPTLHMVGGASAFTTAVRKELLASLQAYRVGDDVTYQGEANRWNAREDHSWVPLRPELVVEVEYDQMEGDRLRHAGRVLRWRTDKEPADCSYDQLEVPARYHLADVLSR